ncbi:MAG: c-type cytochrome domain-containing protein [Cytophagales bacterium]|nr:c-type cytochrome domain-containing protein [Cytophagales bacterium]
MLNIDTFISLFGKFHPLLVHLPIGFVFFGIILEIIDFGHHKYYDVRKYLTISIALSSILSVAAGYTLSLSGEYEGGLLNSHMYTGYTFNILSILWAIWYLTGGQLQYYKAVNKILLILLFTMVCVTGHFGGSLTHGENYLTLNNDESEKPKNKIIVKVPLDKALLYRDVVQNIFDAKCVSCHSASKKKGALRLDNYEKIMQGGESGNVIVPGNAMQSELYKLITMDHVEKRAMPPKGKAPLTPEEIKMIQYWIDAGAKQDSKVSDIKKITEYAVLLSMYIDGIEDTAIQLQPELPIDPLPQEVIQMLKQNGLMVNMLNETSNYLDIRVINNKKAWNDRSTQLLAKAAKNIAILDLSGTSITKNSLEIIENFENLSILYLQNTNLKDADIAILSNIKKLKMLNLYGTSISDASVDILAKLKIEKLHIWNTKITPKGVQKIRSINPKLQIIYETTLEFI